MSYLALKDNSDNTGLDVPGLDLKRRDDTRQDKPFVSGYICVLDGDVICQTFAEKPDDSLSELLQIAKRRGGPWLLRNLVAEARVLPVVLVHRSVAELAE
jgi:hypothetical protein